MRKAKYLSIAVVCVVNLVFMVFPAMGADPQGPFFGPDNPAMVDVGGTPQPAYPEWRNGRIYIQSPWSECQNSEDDFLIQAMTRAARNGVYNQFCHWGRSFTIDTFDEQGYPIGGSYCGNNYECYDYNGGGGYEFKSTRQSAWDLDEGTLRLTKSNASQSAYDQVNLSGQKGVNGEPQGVNVTLQLVASEGSIGVANIASLGVIKPCGEASANSQIWVPLGTNSDGQPAIILDLNGDGVADPEFYQSAGLAAAGDDGDVVIPTLTQFGIAAMALLLLAVGLRHIRQNGAPA